MKTVNKIELNGLLILDKAIGPSSNAAMQQVKRLFQAKKVGHTGSLDPLASGMLPLCFGETTKFSQYLLEADKCYQATGRLGVKTSTADALGEVIATTDTFHITETELTTVMQQFLGCTKQIPSMYSALKHKGQPLYHFARKGLSIEREAREIHIRKLTLLAFNGSDFTIEVHCGKGTYIRNLVEDIGNMLGVYAHVVALRRIYTAGLQGLPMYSLEELQGKSPQDLKACLLPIDKPVDYLPQLCLDSLQIQALQQGKIIQLEKFDKSGLVRLYENGLHFVGLGIIDEEAIVKVKRLTAI